MKFLAFTFRSLRLGIALVLGLGSFAAVAGDVKLEWTPPTECVGGAPISQCPTSGYLIHFGKVASNDVALCTATAMNQSRPHAFPTATSATVVGLDPGNYCFAVQTVSGALTSALSNPLVHVVPAPSPNPPVLKTVTTVAMSVKADWDRLAFVPSQPVGKIPLGLPCDATKPVGDGFYAVERSSVIWSGANRPANVVARCSLQ